MSFLDDFYLIGEAILGVAALIVLSTVASWLFLRWMDRMSRK